MRSSHWRGIAVAFTIAVQPFATAWAQDLAGYWPNYVSQLQQSSPSSTPSVGKPWERFPLRVEISETDTLSTEAYRQAVMRSARRWQRATGNLVSFVFVKDAKPEDIDISVRFRRNEELSLYGGYTTFLPRTGVVIELSATRTSGKPTEVWLLERVATHELGHALGIGGHSPNDGDIMSLNYTTTEISRADLNTLRWAYASAAAKP